MDFASEPVLDAFTPPPTRAALRAPVADDNGQTFGDHLDAVNEPPPERPAPAQQRTDAKDETPRVEAKATTGEDSADHDDAIDADDADVALLGGPLPPAPPPMAAPVAVQIVASQGEQTPAQTAPQDADLNAAPVSAPQAPLPTTPAQEDAATAQPTDQSAPNTGKAEQAADAPAQQQAQQNAPQAPATQTPATVPQIPIAQTTAVSTEALPEAVQQTIAATITPAPQAAAQPTNTQRTGKDAKQQAEAKIAAPEGQPRSDAPVNVRAPTPKAAGEGSIKADTAPILQTQSSAADSSQLTQTNTLASASTQANTHVQHAAADAGAQRAAPVAAQVGREIVRKFSGGNTNFELRLDPADLGRVEVRMEVTRDNRVTAVITADNPQALAELARNARDLEQQLQSAGLQLSDNGLSFDLRQGAQGGENHGQRESGARGASNTAAAAPQEQQAAPLARPIGIDRWRGVRVDLMV